MRRRAGLVFIVSMLVVILTTEAQVPTPVVERISNHFGRTTRVTLFSNHVVVVTVRSETDDFVHKATLGFSEYMVYLQEMERAAHEIGNEPVTSAVEARGSATKLTLHVGPDAPRIISYSPLASLKLPAARIDSIVDDLKNRALSALPGEYEIEHWEPVLGDCVKRLEDGLECTLPIHGVDEIRCQGGPVGGGGHG